MVTAAISGAKDQQPMSTDFSMFRLRVTEARLSLGSEAGPEGPEDREPGIHLSAVVDHTEVLTPDGKDHSALPWAVHIAGPGARSASPVKDPRPGMGAIWYSARLESGEYVEPERLILSLAVGPETLRDLINLINQGVMPAFLMVGAQGADFEATPEGPRCTWDVENDELVVTDFTVDATTAFTPAGLPTEASALPL